MKTKNFNNVGSAHQIKITYKCWCKRVRTRSRARLFVYRNNKMSKQVVSRAQDIYLKRTTLTLVLCCFPNSKTNAESKQHEEANTFIFAAKWRFISIYTDFLQSFIHIDRIWCVISCTFFSWTSHYSNGETIQLSVHAY